MCGGGDLATQLIGEIDELLIKLNPVVLGQGVPLCRSAPDARRFVYSGQELHDDGILWLYYAAAGRDSVKTDG
nr:hypothetical protein [Deinococcus sp. 12RED42]